MNYIRGIAEHVDGESGPIRFVASTEGVKRDGRALDMGRWRLENYRRNPVVLWAHAYSGPVPPIGRAEVTLDAERRMLVADVTFDEGDAFAREIERKIRAGFLNAVSVGWQDVREEQEVYYDLLDVSVVPVPADPQALKIEEARALRMMLEELESPERSAVGDEAGLGRRGAIPPHTTERAPEDTAWDGPGEVAQCPEERAALRRMHAWVDDEADPDTKRAYKLPHHLHTGEVVWRGVAAAMSRLLQGETQIPASDRRGVYDHLARHYAQFDREPPAFREMEAGRATRVGAVLSARNRADLEQAVALIRGVIERAEPAAESGAPGETTREWLAIWRQVEAVATKINAGGRK